MSGNMFPTQPSDDVTDIAKRAIEPFCQLNECHISGCVLGANCPYIIGGQSLRSTPTALTRLPHVVGMIAKRQVSRIHTAFIVARMKYVHAIRYRANKHPVCGSMAGIHAVANPELTVPHSMLAACQPFPTTSIAGILVYFGKESGDSFRLSNNLICAGHIHLHRQLYSEAS